jgi:hypothetical protein
MVHVNRGTTSLGVFSEEQVREGLGTGRFASTDIGWRDGMANWQPLSQFPEFAAVAAPPLSAVQPGGAPTSTPAAPRIGLPWERRNEIGFITAFVETVALVLTRPTEAFTVMGTGGGVGDPLLFGVIGGSIGAIVWSVVSFALQSLGWSGMFAQQSFLEDLIGAGLSGAILVIRLVLTPLLVAAGLFIWAALVHLFLMMVGGANKTFETTFRALSYAYGATNLFVILPCCGWIIALVWGLIADCIGISRTHETDIGRAVMAVLLPLVLCCGGALLCVILIFGGIGALMHQAGQ